MIKQKVYDIAGSNIENLGSDLEWKIKQASAQTEQAWHGVGNREGLRIWRIEKFHVVPWPEEKYGTFYNGDSYIVLHTYKDEGGEFHYDIHFWLGQNTSLDEAGTAAYKTVELDTLLDDKPIQHREVEGFESRLFLSYFKKGVYILDGGIDSGFFHVEPEKHHNRLLKIKGVYRCVHCRTVPLSRESLNSGDVFILDLQQLGKVFQFNGAESGAFEKHKAAEVITDMKQRRRFELIVLDEDSPTSDDNDFWAAIGGKGAIAKQDAEDSLEKKRTDLKLFRLSDRTGALNFEKIAEGKNIRIEMFTPDDVYLVDKGYIVYIWVGSGSSKQEKKSGMTYAQKYIKDYHNNLPLPITVLPQSSERALRGLLK